MEISFSELRNKEVVNLCDGKKLGRACDMIMNTQNKNVLGLVVPGQRKLFKQAEDVFIPWGNIEKIGDDVILVRISLSNAINVVRSPDCCVTSTNVRRDDNSDYILAN